MIIVVGVDDSPHAKTVLLRAIEEARRQMAELHVVHAVHYPSYLDFPIDVDAIAAAERTAIWEPLEALVQGSGVPAKRVDLEGYPSIALSDYARSVGAELLILGTRGRGELASGLLVFGKHLPRGPTYGPLRCAGGATAVPACVVGAESALDNAPSAGARQPCSPSGDIPRHHV